MKIVDVFLFCHELDMLEVRFRIYDPLVDHFVLVESSETFSGHPKPLYFAKNRKRFEPWAHKIQYWEAPRTKRGDAWLREAFQRNQLSNAVQALALHPEDLVMLSDLDEFPNPRLVAGMRKNASLVQRYGCLALQQVLFYYNFGWQKKFPWKGTVVLQHSSWKRNEPEFLRRGRDNFDFLPDGGWHLSYFGTAESIQTKLKSFSHQEFNTPEIRSLQNIEHAKKTGRDLMKRFAMLEDLIPNDTIPDVFIPYITLLLSK